MKRPETKKQKAFFRNLVESDTPRQAAIKAGYNEATAHISAKSNIEHYHDYWSKLLNEAGATDEVLAQTVAEGLKANKVVGYLNNKVNDVEKVSDEFVEVPDYHIRAKYVDIALKLKNAYPAQKVQHSGDSEAPLAIKIIYE